MSMNETPSSERTHIGFFGRRNAGKSSVVNRVTGQDLAVVSDTKGTTTDPVMKSMEILPLGPVVIIDTPGFDDEGQLGELRVQKTRRILDQTDVAVLVVDATVGLGACERQLIELFRQRAVPHLIAHNKCDLLAAPPAVEEGGLLVSGLTGEGIGALKERMATLGKAHEVECPLVRDLLSPGDVVVLVVPIDKAAPKGRLILPQQMMIRDVLDAGAEAVVVGEDRLAQTLGRLSDERRPSLVITDSQVFGEVARVVPAEVRLTSFSILMARHKGLLAGAVQGAAAIDQLVDGDTVLMAEGCTHHRQCGDIGTVKLPQWLAERTGRRLSIATSSGRSFPQDLSPYRLVVHCGGCMLNGREMARRAQVCAEQGVPMTNYGTAIAYLRGILPRSVAAFPAVAALLDDVATAAGTPSPTSGPARS